MLHVQKKEVFDVYIVRRVYLLYVVGGPLSLVKNTQVSSLMGCIYFFVPVPGIVLHTKPGYYMKNACIYITFVCMYECMYVCMYVCMYM